VLNISAKCIAMRPLYVRTVPELVRPSNLLSSVFRSVIQELVASNMVNQRVLLIILARLRRGHSRFIVQSECIRIFR